MSAISSSAESCSNLSKAVPLPANPKQTAFEQCIARVQLVAQQVKLGILNGRVSKLNCPITADFPKDPVLTNCGHLFDRVAIQQWKDQGKPCALCRTPLTQIIPIHAFREFVEERLPKDPVLTCSNFKGSNQQRAARYLELAKSCIDEKEYEEALEFYSKALQYTNAAADYASIPEIYDRLREPEKATLSRLHLSLYQLQEGKIQEAVKTLEGCRPNILNISPLVVGLKLQSCQSRENIEWAMEEASDQNDPDDSIFIYKQILEAAPDRLDAYQKLIPLTKDPKEKRELLLKAADLAHIAKQFDLEMIFRKEAEIPLISNVISKKEWAASQTINLPPYPQKLKDFLAEDCTIWPGKKRSETHIVVPLFPQVAINDAPIPSTLDSLDQLDKSSGGPGYRYLWDQIPKNIPAEKEFHYAVMTNDVIPGSRNKSYDAQLQLIPAGYEMPGVFDAARAILWENRRSGKRCFNDNPWTYTRCKEIIHGYHVVVGGFAPSGLDVNDNYDDNYDDTGVAGWRKFRP